MNGSVKAEGKTLDLLQTSPFVPMGELAREAVKSYVDAQKALMDAIVKPSNGHHAEKPVHHVKHHVRATRKTHMAAATA